MLEKSKCVLTAVGALTSLLACHKPMAHVPQPPPPLSSEKAAKPTINYFEAETATIAAGETSSLRWSVDNATEVQIDSGIGQVKANDRRTVSPAETTTYRLKASNPAGSVEASATVTVSSSPADQFGGQSGPSITVVNAQLRDVHFAYNSEDIRRADRPVLEADAHLLQRLFSSNPEARVIIEGHCDDRGSDEYNFALADRRARAVKDSLVRLGVPSERLEVVSYGRERPLCGSATEECYGRNRRAHFSASQGATLNQVDAPR